MISDGAVGYFDRSAERWDELYDGPDQLGLWLRHRTAVAIRLLGDGPGAVLDAGMGAGRLVAELECRGWTAWGVDGSPRMVELARARVPQAAARLAVARVEQLPFGDESFDAVVSVGVLQFLADIGAATRELARVLRPEGRAVLTLGNRSPNRLWLERVVAPTGRMVRSGLRFDGPRRVSGSPSRAQIKALVAGAGLELQRFEYVDLTALPATLDRLLPGPALRLSRLAEGLGPLRRLAAMHLFVLAQKAAGPERRAVSSA